MPRRLPSPPPPARRSPRARLRLFLVAALAAACPLAARSAAAQAAGRDRAPATVAAAGTAAAGTAAAAAASQPRDDVAVANPVRPGDVLRLRVWREPDMSGDYPVDQWGAVVLPEVGRVVVGGLAADAVERDVVARIVPYLSHRTVAATVLRRVQIAGAVRTPGLYPLDPTVTIGEALSLAGGATPEGRPDRVELVRDGVRQSVRLVPGMRLADSPVRSGDQLRVPERGWWSRNTLVTAALLSAAGSWLVVRGSR